MNKPFVHPEIILKIKHGLEYNLYDTLDKGTYNQAKEDGEKLANEILSHLFKTSQEFGVIESHFNTNRLTSNKHISFKEQIVSLHYQKRKLSTEYVQVVTQEASISKELQKRKTSFFKFLYKKKISILEYSLAEVKSTKENLERVSEESYLGITYEFENQLLKNGYSDFCSSFITLKSCNKIWDVTMTERNLDTKAAAGTSITRNEVKFDLSDLAIIKSTEKTLHLENFNGGDFYFYPNFILYFKSQDEIAIIDYKDLYLFHSDTQFLEQQNSIPSDTKQIGDTWYRVNKDGSPDRRFVGNYKIPIVLYGCLHFKTESGINDLFYTSNNEKAKHFYNEFIKYQSLLQSKTS